MNDDNANAEATESKDLSGAEGLLDNATLENSVAQNNNDVDMPHREEEAAVEPTAKAERPDYISENFWDQEKGEIKIEALAKSQKDLRKMISTGSHKAPKDGKYNEEVFGSVEQDDPIRAHAVSWAKENKISQAAFDDLISSVVKMSEQEENELQFNAAREKEQLGPNADQIIDGMLTWGQGLVAKNIFNSDDFEEFKIMAGTAAGMRTMQKLRDLINPVSVPTQTIAPQESMTMDDLNAMIAGENHDKYINDPSYRRKVEQAFAANIK